MKSKYSEADIDIQKKNNNVDSRNNNYSFKSLSIILNKGFVVQFRIRGTNLATPLSLNILE